MVDCSFLRRVVTRSGGSSAVDESVRAMGVPVDDYDDEDYADPRCPQQCSKVLEVL